MGVDIHAQRLDVFNINFPEAESVCGQLAVSGSVFTEAMLRAKLPKGDLENLIDVNNGDHADEVLADIDTKVIARFLGAE